MAQALRVEIIGDAKSYTAALDKATGATSKFGSGLLKMGKALAVGGGLAAAGAAAFTLKRGFDELAESQKVAAQTGAVLKSTGQAANVTAKEVELLAGSLSKMSGTDDEAIQAGENMLLTFTKVRNEVGKGNDIFTQASSTLLDMATAMNQGATPSAEQLSKQAIQLGKALNDPVKGMGALRRVGVSFTEDQQKTIKALVESGKTMEAQKIILRELQTEFGGSAKAAGDTLPGQLNKLRNAFDEMAGNLTQALVPALTKFTTWATAHMPQIQAAIQSAMSAIGTAVSYVAGLIQRNWQAITQVFGTAGQTILTIAQKLVAFFRTDLGQAVLIAGTFVATFAVGLKVATSAILAFRTAALLAGGSLPIAALGAAATAIAYLGLKTGILHIPFSTAESDSEKLAGSLRDVEQSATRAGDAIAKLAGIDLGVAEAHARLVAANHQVIAAKQALAAASDGTARNTLAELQAQDALTQAQLGAKRAQLDYGQAVEDSRDAHREANAELAKALPSYISVIAEAQRLGESHHAAAAYVRQAGADLQEAGQKAYTASFQMEGASPAAQLAARSLAQLEMSAGSVARALGRVPTLKEIIARAKLEGGPLFIAGLEAWVKKAREAGVKIPPEIQAAINGVSAKAPAAKAAGEAVGAGIGQGLEQGFTAYMARVLATARQQIGALMATIAQASGTSSPSKYTLRMGMWIAEGLELGIRAGTANAATAATKLVAQVQKAFPQLGQTVRSLGLIISQNLTTATDVVRTLGPKLTSAILASLKDTGAAVEKGIKNDVGKGATKGLDSVGKIIVAAATKYGVDARAALAVATTEGGIKFGAVGDKSTSFGPFQMRIGGRNPFGDPKQAAAFANSVKGVEYALRKMAEAGAAGKTGLEAIRIIIEKFEAPAKKFVESNIAKAFDYYKTLPKTVGDAQDAVTAKTKEGGDQRHALTTKELIGIVELVQKYGKTIGLEQARNVALGFFEGSGGPQGIVAQVKAKMIEAAAAAKQAWIDAKAGFISAFQSIASEALSAFDQVTAAWTPPSQRILDKMKLEDQAKQITEGLGSAVTNAETVLAKALASGTDAAVFSAGASLDQALRNQEQKLQATVSVAQRGLEAAQLTGDPEQIAAAQAALNAANVALADFYVKKRALVEENLGLQAAREQRQRDADAAADRTALQTRLTDLLNFLLKHPEAWRKTQDAIIKLLGEYGVPYHKAGKGLAEAFADGIRDGIKEVEKAAKELAAAAAKYMPHKSPADVGPLAFDMVAVGRKWAEDFGSGINSAGAFSLNGGALTPAAVGGGGSMTVNVYGSVVTERQLGDIVYSALLRKQGRNISLGFT